MSDFCRHCGASIPPRFGEGTCPKCDPPMTPTDIEALCAGLEGKPDMHWPVYIEQAVFALRAELQEVSGQRDMYSAVSAGLRAEAAELRSENQRVWDALNSRPTSAERDALQARVRELEAKVETAEDAAAAAIRTSQWQASTNSERNALRAEAKALRKNLKFLRGLCAEREGNGGDIPPWLALEWVDAAMAAGEKS